MAKMRVGEVREQVKQVLRTGAFDFPFTQSLGGVSAPAQDKVRFSLKNGQVFELTIKEIL